MTPVELLRAAALGALAAAAAAQAREVPRGPGLTHDAAVEARRQQTTQRVQQWLRASRGAGLTEAPADRAHREAFERARLEVLQGRQQREALVIDTTPRDARPAASGARRHATLERFKREQEAAVARDREGCCAPVAPSGARRNSLHLPGLSNKDS